MQKPAGLPDNKRLRSFLHFYDHLKGHPELAIALATVAISTITTSILLNRDPLSLFYYSDGPSHLVIARRVVDWIDPGLAQLGSVWLPITHLMLLPFVLNDFLFKTGLAGTFVSTISTAIAAVLLFRIVKFQFNSVGGGLLASALYLLNPIVMYMGVLPMMEAPFNMFFLLFAYYVQQWYWSYNRDRNNVWKHYRLIIKCSFAISAASLTRYEGWVLPFAFLLTMVVVVFLLKKESWRLKFEAYVFVALPYSLAGIIAWLVWNLTIFRDPLYFQTSPYSAAAQIKWMSFYWNEIHHNALYSLFVIFDNAFAIYGLGLMFTSLIGIFAYLLLMKRKKEFLFGVLFLALLLTPVLGDYLALFQGSGAMFPVSNPAVKDLFQGLDNRYTLTHDFLQGFNNRYLIVIAPFLVFASISLVMFLVNKGKTALTGLAAAIVVASVGLNIATQPLLTGNGIYRPGSVTIPGDTYTSSLILYYSYFQDTIEAAKALPKFYTGGKILNFVTSDASEHIIILSGIVPIRNFIDVNAGEYWHASILKPWAYGSYIILKKNPTPQELENLLNQDLYNYWWIDNDNRMKLLDYFHLVYENKAFMILKRNY